MPTEEDLNRWLREALATAANPSRLMFDQWKSYRQKVMPADASAVQVSETRRGFYAGGYAMLLLFKHMPDGLSEDEGVEYLKRLEAECLEFVAKIQIGEA